MVSAVFSYLHQEFILACPVDEFSVERIASVQGEEGRHVHVFNRNFRSFPADPFQDFCKVISVFVNKGCPEWEFPGLSAFRELSA